MVRAKFKVSEIAQVSPDGMRIKLSPVTNAMFFKYTPYSSIEIGTINAEASKQFEYGKEFYVDFTQA
jgi:hypothetical protein